jgi:hypothetical protein
MPKPNLGNCFFGTKVTKLLNFIISGFAYVSHKD